MVFVIGNGEDQRPVAPAVSLAIGDPRDIVHVGGDPVGEQNDVGSRFEPARGLDPVAHHDHRYPLAAQPLERVVERDRHALDQHQYGSCAQRGETARLILDQRLTGERKQRAKPARFILLIRPDQRAKRHNLSPQPGLCAPNPPS